MGARRGGQEGALAHPYKYVNEVFFYEKHVQCASFFYFFLFGNLK